MSMQKIRLIAFDLDGTLLAPDGTVHPISAAVLHRAEQDGVRLAIATGRALAYIQDVRDALQFEAFPENYMITLNGALVYNGRGDLVQREPGMTPEQTDALVRLAADLDIEALCYAEGGKRYSYCPPEFFARREAYLKKYHLKNEQAIEYTIGTSIQLPDAGYSLPVSVYKVALLHSSRRLQEILPALRELLPPDLCAMLVTPCWLEVVPRSISKGAALRSLLLSCGISPEEAAAFGDAENDLAMLDEVEHGYLMANALPAAVSAMKPGTKRAPSNEVNGAAQVVCNLLGYDFSSFENASFR